MSARDYKRSRARQEPFSGWTGVGIGLILGLAVALVVYVSGQPTPARTPEPRTAAEEEKPPGEPEISYDFYDMLTRPEDVVPDRNRDRKPDEPAAAIQKAGAWELQVGSFRKAADADRVRAELALLGIESKIQRVSVDADTWHRVRVGPITDLDKLNGVRDRLGEAGMDALVIRVGG